MSSDLEASRRFAKVKERRDFLGMAATWSTIAALAAAFIGTLRLPMPLSARNEASITSGGFLTLEERIIFTSALASTWFFFSVLITIGFFPKMAAALGIIYLAIGDPLASFLTTGRR